nr:hypothetical protein [Acetobacter syzygii]
MSESPSPSPLHVRWQCHGMAWCGLPCCGLVICFGRAPPAAGRTRPLGQTGLPCLIGFFGNNGVVQPPVRADQPAMQRNRPQSRPAPTRTRQMGQNPVVMWQAARRHLLPCLAPQRYSTFEPIARAQGKQVTIEQAAGIKRHKG